MRNLTLKTIFLVAIASARCVGDLQALSVMEPFLLVFEGQIVLRVDPSFLPKVSSTFHRTQEIVLPSFVSCLTNQKEDSLFRL